MTYEEALEYAKSYLTVKGVPIRSTEATKCIVESLEKQISKKVDKYSRCPSCGYDVTNQADNDYNFEYCYYCGQALDWSDAE